MPRTTCEIAILEDIHPYGFSAAACAEALKTEGDRVEVLINSPGGDVFEGLGICAMLQREKRPVRAVVLGAAASMASVIAAAAPETCMWDSGFMMLHNPSSMVDVWMRGDAEELRDAAGQIIKEADVLDFLKARLVQLYNRGGRAKGDWDKIMNAETWLSAAECLELGLVDKVVPPPVEQAQASARQGWSRSARARIVVPRAQPLQPLPLPIASSGREAPSPPAAPRRTDTETLMPDVKRCGAILIALSGLMALAQEGQGAEDAVEKDLCTNLTTAIAPVASAFQALVPQDQQPTATLRELVQLSEVVVEVTGAKTGQAGAVRALAKNAAASQLLSERAQVGAICDEMVRDGQISPEERVAYAGYSLADIQQAQRLTVKRPLRQQPVDASGAINGTERPEKREQAARDRAWKAIGRTPPETQSTGGAQ